MKITSVNFIKESEMKVPQRNTESAQLVASLMEKLKSAPAGHGVQIKASGIKKWQRYALQKRLQKAGAKCRVTQTEEGFEIKRVSGKD